MLQMLCSSVRGRLDDQLKKKITRKYAFAKQKLGDFFSQLNYHSS